ncbi:hypothetical protein [Streptomyces sp. NPDC007020]|uniref:hypothetical protein n=1 Tax=unclassified Streptomyces TaxID=2593676 RepID=UPI0033FAB099
MLQDVPCGGCGGTGGLAPVLLEPVADRAMGVLPWGAAVCGHQPGDVVKAVEENICGQFGSGVRHGQGGSAHLPLADAAVDHLLQQAGESRGDSSHRLLGDEQHHQCGHQRDTPQVGFGVLGMCDTRSAFRLPPGVRCFITQLLGHGEQEPVEGVGQVPGVLQPVYGQP